MSGEAQRTELSSQWGEPTEAAQNSDVFREFVQRINSLGHQFYERELSKGLAEVEAECDRLVAVAEADGEEAWAVALNAVTEEWQEVCFCLCLLHTRKLSDVH